MKTKVSHNVSEIAEVISTWSGVRAVILQHFVERDVYDPNFSITMDVFLDGSIPDDDERVRLFPDAQYYESSHTGAKDRFVLNDMPVRISYKDCHRVEEILDSLNSDKWLSMEQGTYFFHRLATGTVVWTRDEWIADVRQTLDSLPESFWTVWIESCHSKIDHYFGDLAASSFKADALYFHLSMAGFLKSVAELLFALNHVFLPGPRDLTASLFLLDILPEGFEASWASLLREDPELPFERKREIAELLASGVFALKSEE